MKSFVRQACRGVSYLKLAVRYRRGGHTIWKKSVSKNVAVGVTSGRTANEVSPTNPLVTLFTAAKSTFNPSLGATTIKTRSANEYSAHTFGAQYAWHNPLLNGNNLLSTWGIWPQYTHGPNAVANTPTTAVPSFMRLPKRIWKMLVSERQ